MLIHAKHDGTTNDVIILLHGTGGNENDLVNLSRYIDPHATLIGIRGSVEENGMLRYFKRYPDGSFDLKDLAKQTNELYHGIQELLVYYGKEEANTSILGYSNGANIAINIFKEFETDFKHAMLFHPSSARENIPLKDQKNLTVFATSGLNDPFITPQQFDKLAKNFTSFTHEGGHQLIQDEIIQAKSWYDKHKRSDE